MKTRMLLALAAVFAAIPAMADRDLTDRNIEIRDTLIAAAPDDLRIYEYDAGALDSVPYLLEHARLAEPWAYKALGDCYRYGNGGLEKSLANAICYYVAAGIDIKDLIGQTAKENPDDELVRFYTTLTKVMKYVDSGATDSIPAYLDGANLPDRPWTRTLREYSRLDLPADSSERLLSLVDENSDGEQFLVVFGLKAFMYPKEKEFRPLNKTLLFARKVPLMYNFAGTEYLRDFRDSGSKENLLMAIECLRKADEAGLLDPYTFGRLQSAANEAGVDLTEYFPEDDLKRLRHLQAQHDEELRRELSEEGVSIQMMNDE